MFKVRKNIKPITGRISFIGVTRDTDPDGTITAVQWETSGFGFTIQNVNIISADNTALYNNTNIPVNNATAYLVLIDITSRQFIGNPIPSLTVGLNPTGTNDTVVSQIVPVEISYSNKILKIVYAVVVYGSSQLESNNLIELIFSPQPNIFGEGTTKTSINFLIQI